MQIKITTEFFGTALLLAIVTGSGIMGETLTQATLLWHCWAIALPQAVVYMC